MSATDNVPVNSTSLERTSNESMPPSAVAPNCFSPVASTVPSPSVAPHSRPRRFLFTSESVSEGHPDKLCDQISDAVLDACLAKDPDAKVACEACCKTNYVMIFGEVSVKGAKSTGVSGSQEVSPAAASALDNCGIDFEKVVRETARKVGYDDPAKGLDYRTMEVKVSLEHQSPEIAAGVHINRSQDEIGAGDQGHVFGYACDETPQFMPMSHSIAQGLARQLAKVRKNGTIPLLRPDGKTQVTMEYEEISYSHDHRLRDTISGNDIDTMSTQDDHLVCSPGIEGPSPTAVNASPQSASATRINAEDMYSKKGVLCTRLRPLGVHTIVISAQHDPSLSLEVLRSEILEKVIKKIVPKDLLSERTRFYINPCGSFVVGGPHGDAGLTGRKIIVDTYGGWGSHGGGAFSGKDSTKVDRSAAYMARHIAKSLVANDFCERCLVQISYAIGVSRPLSVYVNTYHTVKAPFTSDQELEQIVSRCFDLRPGKIIEYLKLTTPCFSETASYGHFGRDQFEWEKIRDLSVERLNRANQTTKDPIVARESAAVRPTISN